MKGTLLLLGIVFLLVIAGIHVYRSAEVHTLHVTRAAFENRRHQIELALKSARGADREKLEEKLEELEIDEAILDKEEKDLNSGRLFL